MRGRWRWVVLALVILYIIKSPSTAAVQTNHILAEINHAGSSLGTFVSKLG